MTQYEQGLKNNFIANENIRNKYGYYDARINILKKDIRNDCNGIGIGLLGFVLAGSVLSGFILVVYEILNIYNIAYAMDTLSFYLFNAFASVAGLTIPFLALTVAGKTDLKDLLKFERLKANAVLYVFAAWGICLAANIPVNFINELLKQVGMGSETPSLPESTGVLTFLCKLLAIAVCPAIFEEFVFRGIILSKLRKYGTLFALIVSTLLFGIIHSNFVSIPFACIAGLALGLVYIKTNNLWLCVLVHFLNNGYSVVQEELYNVLGTDVVMNVLTLVFYAIMIIGVVCIAIIDKNNELTGKMENHAEYASLKTKIICAFTNPCVIITVVVSIISAFAFIV